MRMAGRPGQLTDDRKAVILVVPPESVIRAEAIKAQILATSGPRLGKGPSQDVAAQTCVRPPHSQAVEEPGICPVTPEHWVGPLQGKGCSEGSIAIHDVEISGVEVGEKLGSGEALGPLNDALGIQPRRALGESVDHVIEVFGFCRADDWKHRYLFGRLVIDRRPDTAHLPGVVGQRPCGCKRYS
jgi:hypothetical protein